MSLEGIKQVTETEASTHQRKAEAEAQAKAMIADARRAGEKDLADARAEAEAQAKSYMKEAEAKAAKHSEAVVEETGHACDALRRAAKSHMDEAAELIVRRVVNI